MNLRTRILTKWSTAGAILLMIVLTSAVYVNSLRNSFAGDDFNIIVDNDFVKSWRNLPAIFSRDYLDLTPGEGNIGEPNIGSGERTYRPVVTISYFIDYSLWELNSFGYHLTNLILHIANVVLLYLFVALIAKDKKIALLASLFFGLHPINSEAVNAIAFREDLLAFLFYISSFILFIKSDYYKSRKRSLCYMASILLFLLALFSKEMAITLPILLMVYDCYFVFDGKLKKLLTNFKFRYIGYIAVSLFYLWVRVFLMSNTAELLIGYPGGNFYLNFLTMSKVPVSYIIWFLFPVGLHVTLRNPSFFSYSFFTPEALISISTIIALFFLAIALYKRSKPISFAMLWFFITLLPVSNIAPISNIMACRYLYIPIVGLCMLMAVLLDKLAALKVSFVPGHVLSAVARDTIVVLVIFYSTLTIIRNLTWRNNITLWSEAVEYHPRSAFAHRGLADSFRKSELLDKAASEYEKAIRLNSYHAESYNFLGAYYGQKDQHLKSIGYLKWAVKLKPIWAKPYNNLGVTYARMKDYAQAKRAWERALEIDPEYKEVQDNLGKLRELRASGKSIEYLRENEN